MVRLLGSFEDWGERGMDRCLVLSCLDGLICLGSVLCRGAPAYLAEYARGISWQGCGPSRTWRREWMRELEADVINPGASC